MGVHLASVGVEEQQHPVVLGLPHNERRTLDVILEILVLIELHYLDELFSIHITETINNW